VAGAAGNPLLGRHRRGQLLGAFPHHPVGAGDLQQLSALDRQHVWPVPLLKPRTQCRAAAVDLIGGHPRRRHAGVQGTLQHQLGKLRLGPKPDLLRNPRGAAPLRVVGPAFGQVQLPVDERPPLAADIGEEDTQLAVVDLAGRARVLALHPDRGRALLQEARLVHYQHRAFLAQVLHYIGTQIVADPIGVPVGGGKQPLHAVGGALVGVLGQLPAVLAVHVAEQAAQIGQRPPARLRAGEPSRDPGVQALQPSRPRVDLFDVCHLVGLQHDSVLHSAVACRPVSGRQAGTHPLRCCGHLAAQGWPRQPGKPPSSQCSITRRHGSAGSWWALSDHTSSARSGSRNKPSR
jgi:hypothetical protein